MDSALGAVEPSGLNISIMLVKPPSVERRCVPFVQEAIVQSGLEIVSEYAGQLSVEQVADLYKAHKGRDYYEWLTAQMLSGPVHAFLVKGKNAAQRARELAGPTKPEVARKTAPESIRAWLSPVLESFELSRAEERAVDNVVHTPDPEDGSESVMREVGIVFPEAFTGHVL